MIGVTLITPTGGRQTTFDLCERWMERQTFAGDVQWIVVDDVIPTTKTRMSQTVLRPVPYWKPGENTLVRNLRAGLELVKHDAVLIIEDDDWYAPTYIDSMISVLADGHLVGECPSRYYNVSTRCYREPNNRNHASLCQTGFPASMIPRVLAEIGDSPWVDVQLWSRLPGVLHEGRGCVGIKGMPGRPGIGAGHRRGGRQDSDLAVLRSWVGDNDAMEYAQWAA